MEVYLFLFWVAVNLLVGALIGKSKGRLSAGILWSLLLGPIGWLIVAVGPNTKPKCPYCKDTIIPGAVKCRNCGSELKSGEVEPVSKPKIDRAASSIVRKLVIISCSVLLGGLLITITLSLIAGVQIRFFIFMGLLGLCAIGVGLMETYKNRQRREQEMSSLHRAH